MRSNGMCQSALYRALSTLGVFCLILFSVTACVMTNNDAATTTPVSFAPTLPSNGTLAANTVPGTLSVDVVTLTPIVVFPTTSGANGSGAGANTTNGQTGGTTGNTTGSAANNTVPNNTVPNSNIASGNVTDNTTLGNASGGSTTGGTGSLTTGTCTPPTGWIAYTVRAGDSVSLLAAAYGVTVANLSAANCLTDADVIQAGQVVYIPNVTPIPQANVATPVTGVNTINGTTGGTVGGATTGGNTTAKTTVNVTPNGPSIQNIWIAPSYVQTNGQYVVAVNSTVTVQADGVRNASKVTFMMSPIGSTTPPMILGVDTNLADGASIQWQVTVPNLTATIWAVATDNNNANTETARLTIVTAQTTMH